MKNSLKLLSVLFLSVFLLGLVSSANVLTINVPTKGTDISGTTAVLNATFDTNTLSYTNVTWWYRTTPGTGAWTLISNVSQLANATDNYNVTFDTTSFVDADDTIEFNATARNTTNDINSLISKNVTVNINNGNPTATISSSTFSDNLGLIVNTTFIFGIDADATIGISSCKLYFTNQGNNALTTKSVTAVANNCSVSTTASTESLGVNDAYNVRMEATDGNGDKTNSSSRALRVTPASGGGGGGGSSSSTTQDNGDDTGTGAGTGTSGGIGQAISNFFNGIVNFFKNLFN